MKIANPISPETRYKILFDKHLGKGVWEKFKSNYLLLNFSKRSFKTFLEDYDNKCPTRLIGMAFIWGNSPEGNEYWSTLSGKWESIKHMLHI